jgi:hypothetical protein
MVYPWIMLGLAVELAHAGYALLVLCLGWVWIPRRVWAVLVGITVMVQGICEGCPFTLAASRCYELGGLAHRTILLPWILEHFPSDPGSRSLLFVSGLLVLMCALRAAHRPAAAKGIARGLVRTIVGILRADRVRSDCGLVGPSAKVPEGALTVSRS